MTYYTKKKFRKNKLRQEKIYVHDVDTRMSKGLQRYLEIELFPRLQVKVWLKTYSIYICELLAVTSFTRKASNRQLTRRLLRWTRLGARRFFLRKWLGRNTTRRGEVCLQICDCENEVIEDNPNLLLVLVSHDEMTAQANDDTHEMSWAVWQGK